MMSLPATTAVALILGFAAREPVTGRSSVESPPPISFRLAFVAVLAFPGRRTGAPV